MGRTAALIFAAKHDHFTVKSGEDNLCAVAVVAGLVLPFPGLQSPFEINLAAFLQVLEGDIGKLAEDNDFIQPIYMDDYVSTANTKENLIPQIESNSSE